MIRFFNKTSIASRFLLFTLPPIFFVAIVLLALLAWSNIKNVQQQEKLTTQELAVRYARILSRPMWNLEGNTTQDILASLMEENNINCVNLKDNSNELNEIIQGDCENNDVNYEEYNANILYLHNNSLEEIGSLYIQKESLNIIEQLSDILIPQIIVTLITTSLFIFFVLGGFRRSVLRPLLAIQKSIGTFESSGKRHRVEWNSTDELGQLIKAYNASLHQQDTIENELRDQLAVTNSLLNTIPLPVSFLNKNLQFLRCNDSFSRFLHINNSDIIGLEPSQILDNDPWKTLPDNLDEFFTSEDAIFTKETKITLNNNRVLDVIFSCGALRDFSGKIDGIVSVMQDITARKQIETDMVVAKNSAETSYNELRVAQENLIQSEKMASLGSLVAGVAHEINTPLGSSITVASAIDERTKELKSNMDQGLIKRSMLEEYISTIDEASSILKRSLNSAAELVQSFKQVSVDQTSSKKRIFNLDTSIREVLSTVYPAFRNTNYNIVQDLHTDLKLNSYPGSLGQVISNIVNNALIHAFDGQEAGEVTVRTEITDDEYVTIYIEDNGVGISDTNLSHIFDPFFTTKMGSGGTGLGLNVVYNIVNTLLGGKIYVHSKAGVGTVFKIVIPLLAPEQPKPST